MSEDGRIRSDKAEDITLQPFSRSRAIAIAIAIIMLGGVVLLAAAGLFYQNEKEKQQRQLATTARQLVEIQLDHFGHDLRDVANELLLLASHIGLESGAGLESRRSAIAENFLAFMQVSRNTDQLRLLNLQGREIVRVNSSGDSAHIVPDEQLQDKSDRYYFHQMQKLSRNQQYISALDLNIEHKKVEIPYKPTIRFGIAVFDRQGARVGYILINKLAAPMLQRFRNHFSLLIGDVYLIDSDGLVLSAPDPSLAWQTDIRQTSLLGDDPAALWQKLNAVDSGRVETAEVTYLSGNTYPFRELTRIPMLSRSVVPPDYFWKTLIRIDAGHIARAMAPFRKILKQTILLATLALLLLSIPLGILIERRRLHSDHIRLLQQSIEGAGESILVTNAQGLIEYVNPAFSELTGYSAAEAIGKDAAILKSSAQSAAFYQELWETISRGDKWNGTLVNKRKDGTLFPVLMSVAPITDADGIIRHYVGIQQDISKEKVLEEKLNQAQKMEALGTLVGGIAHDFNNTLAAIQSNVFLAKRYIEDTEAVKERLGNIEGLGMGAAEMVRHLLAFARKDRISMKSFSLNSFIQESYKLNKAVIPENISFTCHVCEEELPITGDVTQLQQVVINLLTNAMHAVSSAETPGISCTLEPFEPTTAFRNHHPNLAFDHFAVLTVSDNGCGIEPQYMQRIFDPFFTTKKTGEGTGLGLAMIYGSIQEHDGIIEVESKPGIGTAFHIYLPLQIREEMPEEEAPSEILPGNRETILLVDDNDQIRKTTGQVLREIGYRAIEAKDGRHAVEKFKRNAGKISLVLTDVVMPVLGGVAAAREIRAIDGSVPIIFMTGYDDDKIDENVRSLDRIEVLAKPLEYGELSRIIGGMITGNGKAD